MISKVNFFRIKHAFTFLLGCAAAINHVNSSFDLSLEVIISYSYKQYELVCRMPIEPVHYLYNAVGY